MVVLILRDESALAQDKVKKGLGGQKSKGRAEDRSQESEIKLN